MIHKFLAYLNEVSLDYAIVNGYKDLFKTTLSRGDVDLLFRKKDFLKIESILHEFCELKGFKVVQIYHQEVHAKNIFILNPKTFDLLNLDIYGKLHRKQTTFFTETEIFENRKKFNGVSVLTTHHEFFHYLIKKIDKNDITHSVFNYLRKLYLMEACCMETIGTYFRNLSNVVDDAFRNNNRDQLLEHLEVLKSDIVVNSKISFIYKIKDKIRIFKRVIKPTGITISFLGPDGSGKSTIIDGLLSKTLPFRETAYFHLKPIISKEDSKNEVTINPHKYAPYSKLKSFAKLLFFVYQYNSGWVRNVWSLKIKSTLVVFDRYYDDLIVDHKRYRYGGSKSMARFIRIFIPKPTLYFVLTTDANVIYSRKQEVDYSELQIQVKNYKSLTDEKKYFHIDANKAPNYIVDKVYSILMKKMNERY